MEDPKLTPKEEIWMENEIKTLDLEITYGATNFISDDAPPEYRGGDVLLFPHRLGRYAPAHR